MPSPPASGGVVRPSARIRLFFSKSPEKSGFFRFFKCAAAKRISSKLCQNPLLHAGRRSHRCRRHARPVGQTSGAKKTASVQILNMKGVVMHDTTVTDKAAEVDGGVCPASPEATPVPTTDDPDESWSDETLLHYGRGAMEEGDRLDAQVQPIVRQSIDSRLRGGHAMSILRARLRAEGRWTGYQQENALPRTTVWQVVEAYERATKDRSTAEELIETYGNWTGVLLGYGLVMPRRSRGGGHVVEPLGPPPDEEDNDSQDQDVEGDFDEDDWNEESEDEPEDGDAEEDGDQQESENESENAEPEEEAPPITDEQIATAQAFVSAVGGPRTPCRVLIARAVSRDGKETVKDSLAEAVRAARAVLSPAEISEILIVGSSKVKWAAV